ncbi:NfeD family protein [Leptolyngbya ohadii]|uniref:NfeD family protein n=1 Tax=Leptolyngbya ohadii TaxID=1962290 RepID=UPI000B59F05F|nr:tetratricopeptide repeat protein [Leptolyngbya ohadii]
MPYDPRQGLPPDSFDRQTDDWRNSSESWQGQAIVEREILPRKAGQVYFNNAFWLARCLQEIPITTGEIVDVLQRQGTTLIVEPAFLLKPSRSGLERILEVCQALYEQQDSAQENPQDCPSVIRSTLGDSALNTWQRLLQRKPLNIERFKQCCELLKLDWRRIAGYGNHSDPVVQRSVSPEAAKLSFVGRVRAMSDLEELRKKDARAVLILGEGGLGKTTLASEFLRQQRFALRLEGWMAKESQNLVPAEMLVQEWLQRYFQEDSSPNFRLALDRLRQKLREVSVGILLDNFETALDRHGHLLPDHRHYVALLEVLTDPEVQSFTLITSREPVHEATVRLQSYVLPQLDLNAWTEFFEQQQVQPEPESLAQMHRSYRGNAKAMTILSSTVQLDYEGNLGAYWQAHQDDLLQATDLQDLIASHFDRLQQLYPEAYRLLCRMGCYRFQDIALVPSEALIYLMWDVPETQYGRVLRCLRDWFLVECRQEQDQHQYRLHPAIQAEAIARLRSTPDWQIANQKAASFWTARVRAIQTVEDALTALEAYYHCLQIGDCQAAARVLLFRRHCPWEPEETLGVAAYRIGILQRMTKAIEQIIDRVPPGQILSKLYNHLGDLYWFTGRIQEAMRCHEQSRAIAVQFQIKSLEILALFNTGLCQIELGELPLAMQRFEQVNQLALNPECHVYAVGSWFCLAFLYACCQQPQMARQYVQKVRSEFSLFQGTGWGYGYSLIFLGLTYQHLQEFDLSMRMYQQAQDYAKQSRYILVQAKAFNGIAVIERSRGQFQAAIAHLRNARNLLIQIGAKADLAEVYYQLGLTYQGMRLVEESQASFLMAIELYEQMNAPRQVEKVRNMLGEEKNR